jgi:hypothetical protein
VRTGDGDRRPACMASRSYVKYARSGKAKERYSRQSLCRAPADFGYRANRRSMRRQRAQRCRSFARGLLSCTALQRREVVDPHSSCVRPEHTITVRGSANVSNILLRLLSGIYRLQHPPPPGVTREKGKAEALATSVISMAG